MRKQKHIIQFALLLLLILVLVNLVGQSFSFRWDLTGDDRYTLSGATIDMLENLEEPITVTAYFTEKVPPNYVAVRNEFKDMLIEFSERSKGNLVYEFVNPNEDEELAKEAQEAGVGPVQLQTRKNDRIENILAYMGAELRLGENSDVIPLVQSGERLEYMLASSVRKLSSIEKPFVGFLQGHGEPNVRAIPEALAGLNVTSTVQPMTLFDTIAVNERFSTIMIVNPTDTFSFAHLRQLELFVERGGNLLVSLDRVGADLASDQYGMPQDIGLEVWLAKMGINMKPHFITDQSCGQVQIRQQRGQFPVIVPVQFPYFPLFTDFAEHPITSGLDAVIMQFTAPIEFNGDSSISFTPLIYSSEKSNELPAPVPFDIQKQWTDADFPKSKLVAAAALEGALVPGSPGNRIVVFGNGTFAINGEGQRQQRLNPDNVNLLVNATEWLSDQTGLIELRTRGSNYRPIEELENSKRTQIKWLNFMTPILLVIFYGIIRSRWRKKQREKRRSPSYVQ